jgi:TonB family protein
LRLKKQAKPEHFFHKPRYPGGRKAMDEYIRQEMIYPEEAIKQQIQGIVSLKFDIDEFGTVSNIQVVHSVGAGCDEEAVRLVSLLRFEKTKKQGLKVIFHHSLNIHFRLPIPAPVIGPETVRIQYEIKKDPEPSKPDESGSLGYTIRF